MYVTTENGRTDRKEAQKKPDKKNFCFLTANRAFPLQIELF